MKAETGWEPLADHPAAVTFTPIHTSAQVSGTVRAGQARYSAEVTALTVTITAEAAREEDLPAVTEKALKGIDVRVWPYPVDQQMLIDAVMELEAYNRQRAEA